MNTSDNLVSLVMAVRNERGGLKVAIEELGQLDNYKLELIFVEGGSNDGTYEELMRLKGLPYKHEIKILKQDGAGKKDAVVKGLANATGELTFVFDNDGEIATSELPKFIEVLNSDKNLFLNSDRFLLPMKKQMKFISRFGNRFFAIIMSLAVGRRLNDPLCGLKGASTVNYRKMIASGTFDNDLDKFAEFDQLFGAKRLGLKIKELPVVYRDRRYGESKVHRFRVGWELLKRIGYEFFYRLGFVKNAVVRGSEEKVKSAGFFREWRPESIVFGLVFLAVAGMSFTNLLTYPRIWQDESSTIEQANNVLRYGVPDIEVAPGRLTGVPYLIQSTGYPVEVTLALVFKIFGYGFTQARIFMLAWTLLALFISYYLAKKFFGTSNALMAFLLIASFSSFYNSGRTVVGEIPGFVFLLVGLAYLLKDRYFITGLFFGLAVVTKPSVFGLVIPTIFLTFLLHRAGFFKKLAGVALGMIPAALLWIVIVNGGIMNGDILKEMWIAYSNPFGSPQSLNFITNIANFFHSPTLIYFSLLFLVVLFARFLNSRSKIVIYYDFVLIYSVLAFLYYLRSPGWLRYILIDELLILFLLPHAVSSLSRRFLGSFRFGPVDWKKIVVGATAVLVCVQLFRFSTSANIFYSDATIKTADYINKEFPGKSVAIVNDLPLAVLLNQPVKYKVVTTGFVVIIIVPGKALVDPKPLLVRPPVDIFIVSNYRTIDAASQKILASDYRFLLEMNGSMIYQHR